MGKEYNVFLGFCKVFEPKMYAPVLDYFFLASFPRRSTKTKIFSFPSISIKQYPFISVGHLLTHLSL
jgi:hypothetical protein